MAYRILATLDGSNTSESILPHLESLLRCKDADVILATVTEIGTSNEEKVARAYLDAIAADLGAKGASVRVEILSGDVAKRIIECAAAEKCHLIMMATHGKTGVRRLVMGSVAEKVLRRSPIPVWIVRSGERTRTRKILVPLDGSHRAASVLPHALEFAKATGASITLFTVGPAKQALPADVIAANVVRSEEQVRKAGIDCEVVIRYGKPAKEILDLAREREIDLIAISTHGRTGLDRAIYGSVAEHLLRKGRVPLLVLRTAAILRAHHASAASARIYAKTMESMRDLKREFSANPYTKK